MAAIASPAITNTGVSRMSVALLFEPGNDARRASLVSFAHFVDERHGVLQQRDLALEVFEQALLRRLAGGLRPHRRAALNDGLIDYREVLLQRRRGAGVQRVL